MAEAKDASETKQELSLVCQSEIIFSDPGEDVVLSCHLKPAISAASMEIRWWNKEDLVSHYKDGQIKVGNECRVSLEDLQNGNVSLILRDIRRSQNGHYICEVIHECQTLQANVFLHIRSEDFSLVIPNGTVSAAAGEDVILPAHLSPETSAVSMKIRWFRGAELIYQYKNGQEIISSDYENRVSLSIQELKRGNLSLTLKTFEPSDSGHYACKVIHDGCVQTGTVHLQEIQCDEARLRRVNSVLRRVKNDILMEKLQLLTNTLKMVEETLNQNESSNNTVPTPRRTNSMEGIPPSLREDGMNMKDERLKDVYERGIIHVTTKSSPNTSESYRDQNTGNTATENVFNPNMLAQNLLTEVTKSLGVTGKAFTHAQDNPGATLQNPAKQERSSLSIQSQVQEREKTSQSVTSLTGDTEDGKLRTQRKNCQIM